MEALVERYIRLGLDLGRHVDGFVDAYYGPPQLAADAAAQTKTPAQLTEEARRLLADLAADTDLDPARRHWLAAQTRGLHTSARKLNGEDIAYLDEIEWSYGVRPSQKSEDELAEAHRKLDAVLPGGGPLRERYIAWREAQAISPERLRNVVGDLAEDFRDRTRQMFGLPEGEHVDFELVTDQPWSGFNYYLGDLKSRVAINVDLPVLTPNIGHLVAHEAYPGHHTEHSRKEAGLVRRRQHLEETIFLVGTPQCLIAEGLADLGLEVIAGRRPEPVIEVHLKANQVGYDAEVVATVKEAGEAIGGVSGNAAIMLHDRGATQDDAVAYLERWALLPRKRAEKSVQFLTDPTWRAYGFCYIDGVRLCRQYVDGQPEKFARLITEQMLPEQLELRGTGAAT